MNDLNRSLENACPNSDSEFDVFFTEAYDELKRLAAYRLRLERPNHTLNATALVNEVYCRLREQHSLDFSNRVKFLSFASEVIRRILVNYANARNCEKRGEGIEKVPLDAAKNFLVIQFDTDIIDFISLDEALLNLGKRDKRAEKIVELNYFGGLTVEEIAELLGISTRTVDRDLRFAKTMLFEHMNGGRTK